MATSTKRGSVAGSGAAAGRGAKDLDTAALDAAVSDVAAHISSWAATGTAARVRLLERVIRDTRSAADGWLADACRAKGLGPDSPEAGEELSTGIITFVRLARLLRDSVADIGRSGGTGRPRYPGPVSTAADGRLRVRVFPTSRYDRLMFAKTTGEVWMQPGVTRAEVDAGQAWAYRDPEAAKGLCLVLGAGNVASLGPATCCTSSSSRARWWCSRPTRSTSTWCPTGPGPCAR